MREPDAKLGKLALHLMAHARLATLRSDADELATLARETSLPVLPLDPAQREATLLVLLLRERDRSRRLLALLSGSDNSYVA